MSNLFSCRGCEGTQFTFEQMKKEKYLLVNNRGICKSCHSGYNKINMYNKRASKDPERYLECGDCYRIFSKYEPGAPSVYRHIPQLLRVECPHCKSEEIEAYHSGSELLTA